MTSLLFGIHCHQPVDNFSHVVDEAIEKSYLPFFQTLKEFPRIRISVHFSGWLFEYIEKNAPSLFKLIQSLSSNIEFFSGGYYEPVLSSISSQDRINQIKKLNRYIYKNFNQIPKGLWLTERVWDNALIDDLSECGIEYTVLDDFHFKNSFYNNLDGYYLTQSGDNKIALFAISQPLRYAIPYNECDEVIDMMKQNNLSVIYDDGEKFGIWPKSYEKVYEQGWLKKFLTKLSNDTQITTQTFKEYYEKNHALALAYLAPTSYKEMGLWALEYEQAKKYKILLKNDEVSPFLKASLWQNFFKKYQESNWIHKRVTALSKNQKGKKFKNNLYKAQCNDVLWHGVFGGIYLPNLRDNAYKYIIECEKLIVGKNKNEDIDLDGLEEHRLNSEALLAFFHKKGGQIYEFDLLDACFNIQNTMSRYQEHYHDDVEVGVEDEKDSTIHKDKILVQEAIDFHYDWYLKKSSIDHLSDEGFTLESFANNSFREMGDFANTAYEAKTKKNKITFFKDGGVYTPQKHPSSIAKTFRLKDNALFCEIAVKTHYPDTLHYINEFNLHFCDYEKIFIDGMNLKEQMHLTGDTLVIDDAVLQKRFTFTLDKSMEIFLVKLYTISQSEKGVEGTVQGLSIAFAHEFQHEFSFNLSFIITNL